MSNASDLHQKQPAMSFLGILTAETEKENLFCVAKYTKGWVVYAQLRLVFIQAGFSLAVIL